MAITNPFKIKYGSREVGGTSNTYLLHEPYVLGLSFESLHLEFNVIVVATSYDTDANGLQQLSEALEDDFRKRDQTLIINIDGTEWVYTFGTVLLNTTSSITKSGDPDVDRGFSRMYTCVVDGVMPVDDNSVAKGAITGLQEIEWSVSYEAGRQRIVNARGVYTATESPARKATANYEHDDGADTEATTFLAALSGSATYELVDEDYSKDRNDHTLTFTRRYEELLVDQTAGTRDAVQVRDTEITFVLQSQHPGDSQESLQRLRRVVGTYDCAVDIDQTTDLQSVYENQVRGHVLALFKSTFNPQVFCIEARQVSYNESAKRLSVAITFLYQSPGGDDLIELTASLTTNTVHFLDYTPTHSGDEFAAYVDQGFGSRERISRRTAIVLGEGTVLGEGGNSSSGGETESVGTGGSPGSGPVFQAHMGGIGAFHRKWGAPFGKGGTWTGGYDPEKGSGWDTISNTATATPQWIGDPDEDQQIEVLVVEEEVVQRWHTDPGATTSPFPRFNFPGPQ